MPVYSMTGYASASAGGLDDALRRTTAATRRARERRVAEGRRTVELRSVNGRFLDLALRLPDDLRALEPALRELSRARAGAARSSCASPRSASPSAWPQPQPDQLSRLSRLESTVQSWLPKAAPLPCTRR